MAGEDREALVRDNSRQWTASNRIEAEGLEWLYTDPSAAKSQPNQLEEYLLGKSIEGARGELARDESDQANAGSLLKEQVRDANLDSMLSKFREDPLFIIKKAEMHQRQVIQKYESLAQSSQKISEAIEGDDGLKRPRSREDSYRGAGHRKYTREYSYDRAERRSRGFSRRHCRGQSPSRGREDSRSYSSRSRSISGSYPMERYRRKSKHGSRDRHHSRRHREYPRQYHEDVKLHREESRRLSEVKRQKCHRRDEKFHREEERRSRRGYSIRRRSVSGSSDDYYREAIRRKRGPSRRRRESPEVDIYGRTIRGRRGRRSGARDRRSYSGSGSFRSYSSTPRSGEMYATGARKDARRRRQSSYRRRSRSSRSTDSPSSGSCYSSSYASPSRSYSGERERRGHISTENKRKRRSSLDEKERKKPKQGPELPKKRDTLKYAFAVTEDIKPPQSILYKAAQRRREVKEQRELQKDLQKESDVGTRLEEMQAVGAQHLQTRLKQMEEHDQKVQSTEEEPQKSEGGYLEAVKKHAYESAKLSERIRQRASKNLIEDE